jgi:hypothetical protein
MRRQLRRRFAPLFCLLILASTILATRLAQSEESAPSTLAATVEGVIFTKDIPGVSVHLERVSSNPLATFDGYTVMVQPDGTFRFEDVAPGAYRLTAEAPVMLHGEFGAKATGEPGTVLEIKPSEHRRGLAIVLFPDPPAICGQVLDADGRPLRATVEVYGSTGTGDGTVLRPMEPSRLTNAHGDFVFPSLFYQGHYYLRANGIWYPSTENLEQARPLASTPASNSRCTAKIRMPRARCVGIRVVGSIRNALKDPVSEFEVSLNQVNPSGLLFVADRHPLYRANNVEFDGVCEGRYEIVVRNTWVHHAQYFASPIFQIHTEAHRPANARPIVVSLSEFTQQELNKSREAAIAQAPLASIDGHLRLDGFDWNHACPTHVSQQLGLMKDDELNGVFAGLDAQGHFKFEKLRPGIYQLSPGSFVHDSVYVKKFEVDGRAADPLKLTLASGHAVHVELVIGNDRAHAEARMSGTPSDKPHYLPAGTHPSASLSGTLTGPAANGAPIELHAIRFNSARSMLYKTTSSTSGAFQFDAVDPGIYVLSTEGPRHQYSANGAKGPGLEGKPIVLSAGQHATGLNLETFPRSSLCGKVLDIDVKPRVGIDVWLEGQRMTGSSVPHGPLKVHAVTDEQGIFKLTDAGPGKYLELWAETGDRRIYFPSAWEFDQARRIDLGTSDTACVYNIYLPATPGNSARSGYHVSGMIKGKLDPSLGNRFRVNLTPVDATLNPPVKPQEIKADGSFDLKAVWPGRYTLTLTSTYGNGLMGCSAICYGETQHLLATQQIEVASAAIDGLQLEVRALPEITGEILIDGKAPAAEMSRRWSGWTPSMSKIEHFERPATAKLDDHGHFSFSLLDAEDYNFFPNNFWPDYYVQTVLLDGNPIVGSPIPLHFGESAQLTVRVATDGASGTIRNRPSQPPVDPYRDLCQNFGGSSSAVRLMIPDPLPDDDSGIIEGRYRTDDESSVNGVPPGHYRIVATANLAMAGQFHVGHRIPLYSNHEFLVRLAALGEPVEVKANEKGDWMAPLVTEQMQQLMSEMGLPAARYY